jgi:alpha-tubulin suppressor-like RCC1 family protein
MKKVVSLASLLSIALASFLVAPTHAVVPLGNPLAAGSEFSLIIANPVPNPTLVNPPFAPQNVVHGMGHNDSGDLGSIPPLNSGSSVPHIVGCRAASPPPPFGDYPLALVVQVVAGPIHGVALRSNGDVVTFGRNESGQLGYTSALDFHCPTFFSAPVPLNTLGARPAPVWAVAAGNYSTFALQGTAQGYSIIKAWGSQPLGTGKPWTAGSYGPECVRNNIYPLGTCLYPVVSVAAGVQHGAAVTTDGKVHTWGENLFGQLGQVRAASRNYALVVPGIENVVSVAAADTITFALKQDGTVWCWGKFHREHAGTFDVPPSCGATPTRVPHLNNVTSIAAGVDHALAITVDGRVWAWGYNEGGALGDPNVYFTVDPVLVDVPGFAVAIAAGPLHSLARTADGKTWAWGYNYFGQLGDGTYVDRYSPVEVLP